MKFRVACIIAIVLMSIPSMGFVCATRVEKMEADIAALQLQFAEIQKSVNNDQTQLTEMILRADKKLEELGSTQNQTHDQVAQQNVQLALELEQSRNELANMRGRLDVQQKALEEMQASMQTVMGSVASTNSGNSVILPSDQEGLYQFVQQKHAAGDSATALAGELEYVRRYPNDVRIEPMMANIVTAYNKQGQDRDVITYSTKYLQVFPKGPNRNEVVYNMGDSALKIRNCSLAQKSFAMLKAEKYRDSEERAKEAASCK